MKIQLDHDDMVAILRAHVGTMFPGFEVKEIYGLGYADVEVRLESKEEGKWIEPPAPRIRHIEPESDINGVNA